jgi:predicted secreted protein
MSAADKISKILELINAGRTVYVSTMTRCTKLDKRALDRFAKGGHTMLKAVGNSMYMAAGSKFVCIDLCKFTVEG